MGDQNADQSVEQALKQFDSALAEFGRARSTNPHASSLALLERSRMLMTVPGGL